jgi:hypothetical protein
MTTTIVKHAKELTMNKTATLAGTAAILLITGGIASAASAVATTDLNVRSGQGTNNRVVGTIPGGSEVDVRGCGDGWCYVSEYGGYASARYLDRSYAGYGTPRSYAATPTVRRHITVRRHTTARPTTAVRGSRSASVSARRHTGATATGATVTGDARRHTRRNPAGPRQPIRVRFPPRVDLWRRPSTRSWRA